MFNMRLVLISALLASVLAEPVPIVRGYHEEQGIPMAKEIRAAEELAAKNPSLKQRIVGGYFAPENQHPYLAGLLIDIVGLIDDWSICGASLLSANRLVTAAHCWFDGRQQASQFTVVLGSLSLYSGGTRIATRHVVTHDLWEPDNMYQYDIAMIYLPISVAFSESVASVALPEGMELRLTYEGQTAVAVGYGRTSDQNRIIPRDAAVKHVLVTIMSTFNCQAYYGSHANDGIICTDGSDGRGTCQGDSGGPLVTYSNGRLVLVGVLSFVDINGCQTGFPSAFTRVTSYYDFIRQHL